jgi:hypothetical protein
LATECCHFRGHGNVHWLLPVAPSGINCRTTYPKGERGVVRRHPPSRPERHRGKVGIEIGFGREGRARTRTINITTAPGRFILRVESEDGWRVDSEGRQRLKLTPFISEVERD